jgi:hypothetical protein
MTQRPLTTQGTAAEGNEFHTALYKHTTTYIFAGWLPG